MKNKRNYDARIHKHQVYFFWLHYKWEVLSTIRHEKYLGSLYNFGKKIHSLGVTEIRKENVSVRSWRGVSEHFLL